MLSPHDLSRLATALGGLPVLGCMAGSPAEEAGMRYGDILLSINGTKTGSLEEFLHARNHCQGRMVARVFRQGVELELAFQLRPANKTPLEILEELKSRGILPSGFDA
jgi:predicted metalloprotease with PDZ domain